MFDNTSRRKFIKVGSSAVGISPLMAGCLGIGDDSEDTKEWTLASPVGEGHGFTRAANNFKDEIEELSDGEFQINVESGGVYGGELEQNETVSSGGVEMASTSFGIVVIAYLGARYYIPMGIMFGMERPKWEHILNVWNQLDEGNELTNQIAEEHNLQVITDPILVGDRHIAANKAIREPSDAEEVAIRAPQAPGWANYFSAMGFTPETVSITETYSALESGTIDAQEGEPTQQISEGFYEVQTHYNLTNHFPNQNNLIMNSEVYNNLTEDEKEMILEAGENIFEPTQDANIQQNEAAIETLSEEHGLTIIEDINTSAFRERVIPVAEELFEEMESPLSVDEVMELSP